MSRMVTMLMVIVTMLMMLMMLLMLMMMVIVAICPTRTPVVHGRPTYASVAGRSSLPLPLLLPLLLLWLMMVSLPKLMSGMVTLCSPAAPCAFSS